MQRRADTRQVTVMTDKTIDMYCDACDTEFCIKIHINEGTEYEEERPEVEFCPFCGEVILEDEELEENDIGELE